MESFAQTGSRDGSTSPCEQSGGRQTRHAVRRASRAGHPAPAAVARACWLPAPPPVAAAPVGDNELGWTVSLRDPHMGWVARLGLHGEWFGGWNLNVKCALLRAWKKSTLPLNFSESLFFLSKL